MDPPADATPAASPFPVPSSLVRVEVVTLFWARITDRALHWTDVMHRLGKGEQVRGSSERVWESGRGQMILAP